MENSEKPFDPYEGVTLSPEHFIKQMRMIITPNIDVSDEVLINYTKAGMNVIRCDLSKTQIGQKKFTERVKDIRKRLEEKLNLSIPLMLHCQGYNIRMGEIKSGKTMIRKGQVFRIIGKQPNYKTHIVGDNRYIFCNLGNWLKKLQKDDKILLDFGDNQLFQRGFVVKEKESFKNADEELNNELSSQGISELKVGGVLNGGTLPDTKRALSSCSLHDNRKREQPPELLDIRRKRFEKLRPLEIKKRSEIEEDDLPSPLLEAEEILKKKGIFSTNSKNVPEINSEFDFDSNIRKNPDKEASPIRKNSSLERKDIQSPTKQKLVLKHGTSMLVNPRYEKIKNSELMIDFNTNSKDKDSQSNKSKSSSSSYLKSIHRAGANKAIMKKATQNLVLKCIALEDFELRSFQEIFIQQKNAENCVIPRINDGISRFKNVYNKDRARINNVDIDYISIGDVRAKDELNNAISVTEGSYLTRKIAEIKTIEGVYTIKDIVSTDIDGVVLCRDVLMNYPEYTKDLQDETIEICKRSMKSVFIQGEVLPSILHKKNPSCIELDDMRRLVESNIDGLILEQEQCDDYTFQSYLETINRLCLETEKEKSLKMFEHPTFEYKEAIIPEPLCKFKKAIVPAVAMITQFNDIKVIMCVSQSGNTLRYLSLFNYPCPILVLCPKVTTARRCSYYKGIFALSLGTLISNEMVTQKGIKYVKKLNLVKKGDLVLVVYGFVDNATGLTDSLTIEEV